MKKYKKIWIKRKYVLEDENVKVHHLDCPAKEDKIDIREIIIKTLKMYNLTEVEEMNYHADLANDIINDLVNAGFLK